MDSNGVICLCLIYDLFIGALRSSRMLLMFPFWKGRAQGCFAFCFLLLYMPRKSKDQTLPIGSRESFIGIILKTILCLVLDSKGVCMYIYIYLFYICFFWWISSTNVFFHIVLETRQGLLKTSPVIGVCSERPLQSRSEQVVKLLNPKLWRHFFYGVATEKCIHSSDLTRPKNPKR